MMDAQRPVRRRRRRKESHGLWQTPVRPLILLAVVLFVLILVLEPGDQATADLDLLANPTGTTESLSTTPLPTEPPSGKIATATIGSTGDMILHTRVIEGGKKSDGSYDFDSIFTYVAEDVAGVDYSVINMEGTLCGEDNGYPYKGYPRFNAPDAIVDAAKDAGFDMMLTANNHSYDTGSAGFIRTQEVIASRGLDYIGTRLQADDPNYLIQEIGGIRVGMTCYTFDTGTNSDGSKSINSIPMTTADSRRINTFNNWSPEDLYQKLEPEMAAMREAGAECIVLFIHWGDEYKTVPNNRQRIMAQTLCDMGVDVIVGSHPHVIQPVELLTSENGHTTLCLYSLGNAVSNIRTEDGFGSHTEDGMFFTFTLAKYSDGTVLVERAEILPTWVNRYTSAETGREVFAILPLTRDVDWQTAYGLSSTALTEAEASLKRTQEIVSEPLNAVNTELARLQAQAEAAMDPA